VFGICLLVSTVIGFHFNKPGSVKWVAVSIREALSEADGDFFENKIHILHFTFVKINNHSLEAFPTSAVIKYRKLNMKYGRKFTGTRLFINALRSQDSNTLFGEKLMDTDVTGVDSSRSMPIHLQLKSHKM